MKASRYIIAATCLGLGLGLAIAKSKDKAVQPATTQQQMPPQMTAYMTPGEGQKRLDPFVGNWTFTLNSWMMRGGPTQTMTGRQETKWINGNRQLQMTAHAAPSPVSNNQPYEGIGYTVFDNMTKEYVSTWFDNMGTGMMISTGQFSGDGKVLEQKGTMPDPMTGEKAKPFRTISRWTDADTNVYEMYTLDQAGNEYRAMEITYKRVK